MSMADSLWVFGLRSLATEYGWAGLERRGNLYEVRA